MLLMCSLVDIRVHKMILIERMTGLVPTPIQVLVIIQVRSIDQLSKRIFLGHFLLSMNIETFAKILFSDGTL
jgi:hypothetical protein